VQQLLRRGEPSKVLSSPDSMLLRLGASLAVRSPFADGRCVCNLRACFLDCLQQRRGLEFAEQSGARRRSNSGRERTDAEQADDAAGRDGPPHHAQYVTRNEHFAGSDTGWACRAPGPLEEWKRAALRRIQDLKRKYKISWRMYCHLINEAHDASSFDCRLVRLFDTFDGKEDEDSLVEQLKATYAQHVPLSNPTSSQS
jgi:hypothetical protein